ncbi:MAG: hypothetical protein K8823_315 [Cenarchaeum symbiont of Oopsacas minuta]|nr:hypothetical protein [Cenarchaeum symbiont of Oopsacas minuta]
MSSELRIKKLRGSGGYIMASLTDEQQSKGNLGGPDLFLAPIGRLPNELISKYFCNTCEKEMKGCPEIDYESPNEEVADNLVLAERGKYSCTECGSAIAEYRQFVKPNESNEVGLAKPQQPSQQTIVSQQTQISTPTDNAKGEIKPIDGMVVYDGSGIKVGTAGQIGIDDSQSLVLTIDKNDGTSITVPWSHVKKVGEIILLNGKDDSAKPSDECPECGETNKPGSKFCEQCGSKI